MPAAAERFGSIPPRERVSALVAVVVVQLALGLALLSGFRVDVPRAGELVTRLIDVTLAPPPPVVRIEPRPRPRAHAAPPPRLAQPGGTRGPATRGQSVIARVPTTPPVAAVAGGGAGTGPSQGSGSGGASGTGGSGEDEGGTDLIQIAGAI